MVPFRPTWISPTSPSETVWIRTPASASSSKMSQASPPERVSRSRDSQITRSTRPARAASSRAARPGRPARVAPVSAASVKVRSAATVAPSRSASAPTLRSWSAIELGDCKSEE
jgi:hypothetical protein